MESRCSEKRNFSIKSILGLPAEPTPDVRGVVQVQTMGTTSKEGLLQRNQPGPLQLTFGIPPLALQQAWLLQTVKRSTVPSSGFLAGGPRKANKPNDSITESSFSDSGSEEGSPTDRSPTARVSKEDESRTKTKKMRTSFSQFQSEELERKFNEIKYLTKKDRVSLSSTLGISEKIVKTWYQNRRTKWKKTFSEEALRKNREVAAVKGYMQHIHEKDS